MELKAEPKGPAHVVCGGLGAENGIVLFHITIVEGRSEGDSDSRGPLKFRYDSNRRPACGRQGLKPFRSQVSGPRPRRYASHLP